MEQQATHAMELVSDGTAAPHEFWCRVCDRRLLVWFEPWRCIVLEAGDEWAGHSGGMGGVTIGQVMVSQAPHE